uniref:Uncharacterized protein n=1 Tax=Guillardia theta TaxID=55529 RepID=A0A7S4N1I1_GUITH
MNIVDDFLTWGGDLLFKFRPDFPFERPTSSIPASWYISPKQTFGELVVWNLFFWTLTYVIFMRCDFRRRLGLPKHGVRKVTYGDVFLGTQVLASLLWVLYYKYLTNTVVYILQPCHLVSIMLVYLFWCRDIAHGSLIFSMFTHMNVGTLLALGFPDLTDYRRRGIYPAFSIFNFFVLHVLLAVAPLHFEWQESFPFKKGLFAVTMGFALLGILHWTILLPVSILVGNNINYMMSPPKGPLLWFGDHYRSIQTFGTYLLLLLPGLLFPAMVDLAKRMSGKWRRQKSA